MIERGRVIGRNSRPYWVTLPFYPELQYEPILKNNNMAIKVWLENTSMCDILGLFLSIESKQKQKKMCSNPSDSYGSHVYMTIFGPKVQIFLFLSKNS